MKKRVLIIGPIMPPMGGVSVHIDRLSHILKQTHEVFFIDDSAEIKPNVPNLRKMSVRRYLRLVSRAQVVHIHSGLRLLLYFHIIAAKLLGKNIVLTIHSYKENSFLLKAIDRLIYSLPDITVVVSRRIAGILNLRKRYIVRDAFLPPIFEKEPHLPHVVKDWIDARKREGFSIAINNASRLVTFDNADLYGFDLCITAAARLKSKNMKVAFVLIACIPDGDIRIETYEEQIAKLGLENRFLILREGISFARLIGECNLVLRTTNTDGDALTVREALYLGKPVIASDVVERPDGTHLFKNRNADSLAEVIENTLNNDINYLPGSSNDKTRQLQSDVLLLYSG